MSSQRWRPSAAESEREGAAADRDGSSHASAISGRSASGDGRRTASRAKVTPSGSVASARIRQIGTGPLPKACAGGNGGTGSLSASASCALRDEGVDTLGGCVRQREQHAAPGGGGIDARLARIDGDRRRDAVVHVRRHAQHARHLADRLERRIGRPVLEVRGPVLGQLGTVGPAQVVGIAPVVDRVDERRPPPRRRGRQ